MLAASYTFYVISKPQHSSIHYVITPCLECISHSINCGSIKELTKSLVRVPTLSHVGMEQL